jgi:hypothetical protein
MIPQNNIPTPTTQLPPPGIKPQVPPQTPPPKLVPEPQKPQPVEPTPAPAEQPEQQIQAPNSASSVKMNDLMLWYAVSAYAYAYTYLQVVKDIQDAPDGRGIFNTTVTSMIGILDAGTIQDEASANKSLDEEEQQNAQSVQVILNDKRNEDPDEADAIARQFAEMNAKVIEPEVSPVMREFTAPNEAK